MNESRQRRSWIRWIAMAMTAAPLAIVAPTQAQISGSRPIRIIVPTTPGGGMDFYGRLLAQELAPLLEQPLMVENRPGASNNIGSDYVAKSAPDGFTLLLNVNVYAISAAVYKSLPYDPLKDLIPVTILGTAPFVIVVNASLPVRDLAQLVALSKTPGSNLAYASCNNGSPQHLAGELFKSMTGAEMLHVPYKGCAPAITDVIGGRVQVSFNVLSTTMPHVLSGKVRVLSLTTKKRSLLAPNLPTAEESGLAGYDVNQWFGLFAPAKTPREIIDRLNASIAKALDREEVVKKLVAQGIEPAHGTPEEFDQLLRSDIARWGKLAKLINLKLD